MNDLISRQAAIEAVGDVHPLDYNGQAILTRLKELPTIDTVKRGRWNDHTCMNWHGWHCSVCDHETQRRTNYCPNCGAMMERSEE